MSALAPVLEGFFTDRLTARQASPHTVIAYRDTYRLLLQFTQTRLRTPPSKLDLADLDATLIGAFLDHLETDRGNAVLTRNLRLAAIHALFHYAALRCPEHANTIARVLAIPSKRPNRGTVTFLTRPESNALLAAIDRASPLGRRDHLLLTVAIHTGLRVSELTGLRRADLTLGAGAHVRCTGKGRKERATPLTRPLAALLNSWLQDRNAAPNDPLFPNRIGGPLNTDSVTDLLDKHVVTATPRCPSLGTRRITPHTLRHTCAMNLLQAGVDTSSIALWLGHSGTKAVQVYLHADLTLKEQTLARTAPDAPAARRYRPPDRLLAFLEGL